jgi:hypothetical protein
VPFASPESVHVLPVVEVTSTPPRYTLYDVAPLTTCHESVAIVSPGVPTRPVGAPAAAATGEDVTGADAADCGEFCFTAVTVQVYDWPFASPVSAYDAPAAEPTNVPSR